MKLLFYISNRAHCITALNIIKYYERNSLAIDAQFIVCDHYNNFHSGDYLEENGYRFYNIPRRNDSEKSIWNSPMEAEKNFFIIKSFFKKLIKNIIPDLAIMVPYEAWVFNVTFIDICKRNGIKTLLLQEGLVVNDNNKEPHLHNKPFDYFFLSNRDNKNLSLCRYRRFAKKLKVTISKYNNINIFKLIDFIRTIHFRFIRFQFPTIRPFGLNGADYIGTLSPFYSSKLIERGLPAEKIRSIGLARFDDIIVFANQKKKITGWPEFFHSRIIRVLYPQTMGYEFGKFESVNRDIILIKKIFKGIDANKFIITYRLRAEENLDNYKKFLNINYLKLEDATKISAYESIIKNDILISTGSTMLLEALALKRYAILFNSLKNDYYGYYKSGSTLIAWDSKSILQAITEIVQNSDLRKRMQINASMFVQERAMIDGKSTEKICSFINDIVKQKR